MGRIVVCLLYAPNRVSDRNVRVPNMTRGFLLTDGNLTSVNQHDFRLVELDATVLESMAAAIYAA